MSIEPLLFGQDKAALMLVQARIEQTPLRSDRSLKPFECVFNMRGGVVMSVRAHNPQLLKLWLEAWVGRRMRSDWTFRAEYPTPALRRRGPR